MKNLFAEKPAPTFQPSRILSVANSASLLNWVTQQIEAECPVLILDFCQVMFMDSTGLGTLVTVLKLVNQAERRLVLCSLRGQARMLFEMAGMETVFEVFDSPADFAAGVPAHSI